MSKYFHTDTATDRGVQACTALHLEFVSLAPGSGRSWAWDGEAWFLVEYRPTRNRERITVRAWRIERSAFGSAPAWRTRWNAEAHRWEGFNHPSLRNPVHPDVDVYGRMHKADRRTEITAWAERALTADVLAAHDEQLSLIA